MLFGGIEVILWFFDGEVVMMYVIFVVEEMLVG